MTIPMVTVAASPARSACVPEPTATRDTSIRLRPLSNSSIFKPIRTNSTTSPRMPSTPNFFTNYASAAINSPRRSGLSNEFA